MGIEVILLSSLAFSLLLFGSYDDLKPPTSPSPNGPSSQEDLKVDATPKATSDTETTTAVLPTTTTETRSALREVPKTRPLSPYPV